MLYNPTWERIYTIESFAAWLASKPKGETYNFTEPENCAAAQYLKAQGVQDYNLSNDRLRELGWYDIVNAPWDKTFGGAARRAECIQRGGWRLAIARLFLLV
jgi:hypothetical protein